MKTLVILLLIFFFENRSEAKQSIIIQSTTSTKNSGFYNYVLPIFEKKAGFKVHVVAVGTGAAIKNAKNCDGDVLIVHSPLREKKCMQPA